MNSVEAKKILLAFRPGSTDARDPEVAEALALAQKDPELQKWMAEQTTFQQSMQESFRQIPVPGDLRDRILAGAKVVKPNHWRQHRAALAAAAGLVFLIGLATLWFRTSREDEFQTFLFRMAGTVLRQYTMDVVTNDMSAIRQFLASRHAPSDYVLSPALARLPATGAGVLSWQRERVSMVCLDSGSRGTLFLFVVEGSAFKHPPPATPKFAQVNKLATASWIENGRIHVLAGHGEEVWLQKHFKVD